MKLLFSLFYLATTTGLTPPKTPTRRAALMVPVLVPTLAFADATKLFDGNCAACHAGGGNIIARTKTLSKQDLAANKLDKPALATLIADGKGAMPGYGEACAPKIACTFGPRLTTDEINDLAQYTLDQAEKDWK